MKVQNLSISYKDFLKNLHGWGIKFTIQMACSEIKLKKQLLFVPGQSNFNSLDAH